jgi:hypothetical protein
MKKCDYFIHLLHYTDSQPNPNFQYNNQSFKLLFGKSKKMCACFSIVVEKKISKIGVPFVDRSTPMPKIDSRLEKLIYIASRLFYIPFATDYYHLQRDNYVLLKKI